MTEDLGRPPPPAAVRPGRQLGRGLLDESFDLRHAGDVRRAQWRCLVHTHPAVPFE